MWLLMISCGKSYQPVKTRLKGLFFDTCMEVVDDRLYRGELEVVLKGVFVSEFFIRNELCAVAFQLRELVVNDSGLATKLWHGRVVDFFKVGLCSWFGIYKEHDDDGMVFFLGDCAPLLFGKGLEVFGVDGLCRL